MSDLRDLRFCLSGGERVGWTGSADFIQIAASRHENVKVTSTVRGALASMLGYRTTRPPRMGGVTIFRTSPSLPLVSNRYQSRLIMTGCRPLASDDVLHTVC